MQVTKLLKMNNNKNCMRFSKRKNYKLIARCKMGPMITCRIMVSTGPDKPNWINDSIQEVASKAFMLKFHFDVIFLENILYLTKKKIIVNGEYNYFRGTWLLFSKVEI